MPTTPPVCSSPLFLMRHATEEELGMTVEEWADFLCEVTAKIRNGVSRERAMLACGISRHRQRIWLKLSSEGIEPLYGFFHEVLDSAEATFESNNVSKIEKHKDWKSSAWLLERRNPEKWGQKIQLEVRQEVIKVLDAAQRILPVDLYEKLLTEIESSDSGHDSERASAESDDVEDRLH